MGRESNDTYGETYNGVELMTRHQFPDGIDPYRIEGDPLSGLLWGISDAEVAPWVAESAARWLSESRRLLAASPRVRAFVLPSGSEAACRAHVCRTVCRRAERRVCVLPPAPATLAAQDYLNRLSSYFFALARRLNALAGCVEEVYVPLTPAGGRIGKGDSVSADVE